jgi:hypothetical protein
MIMYDESDMWEVSAGLTHLTLEQRRPIVHY